MLNPLLNYRAMTREATAAVMQDEAQFFDAMLSSDGSDAEIDIEVPDPEGGPGATKLLTVPLLREKTRTRAQEKGDGTPTLQEPNRTAVVYSGPRSLLEHIERMGGRTLKVDGLRLTISYANPRKIANVVYAVDLICDPEEGLFLPAGKGGLL